MTEYELFQALRPLYPAAEYALLPQVANATGARTKRHCDALALSLWPSRGLHLHGFEMKRWATPRDVYQALDDEFCFDFDPCPLDGTEDGLATRWDGRRVFCNPPYGPGLAKWLERGLEANLAVFLIPARTDTRWFHDIVLPKAKEIRFIKGRLKFGDAVNSAPFPSMIVVFKQ